MRELIINCMSIVLAIASVVLAVRSSPLYLSFLLIPCGVLAYRDRERARNQEAELEAIKDMFFPRRKRPPIPEEMRGDKKAVLAAVRHDGRVLWWALEEMRDDKEVVLAAVQQNGRALEYASVRLRDDKDVVLAAVPQNGSALEHASARLRNDKDVVLAAVRNCVRQWGSVLRFASLRLRDDKNVVLAAVRKYDCALKYASLRLRNDKDVVLAAVRNDDSALLWAGNDVFNSNVTWLFDHVPSQRCIPQDVVRESVLPYLALKDKLQVALVVNVQEKVTRLRLRLRSAAKIQSWLRPKLLQGLRKRLEHRVFARIKNGIVSPHKNREVSDQYECQLNQSAFLIQKTWRDYRQSKDLAADSPKPVVGAAAPTDNDSPDVARGLLEFSNSATKKDNAGKCQWTTFSLIAGC